MQMNVRNTLNGASCIGIKTAPSQEDPSSFAVRAAVCLLSAFKRPYQKPAGFFLCIHIYLPCRDV